LNQNNHISETDLIHFHQAKMTAQEKLNFLTHISSCDFCAELFATSVEQELIDAPVDMKSNLFNAVGRPNMQITQKFKATSKRIQLFWYSLKVGTAAIGALLLLLLFMNCSPVRPVPDGGFKTRRNLYPIHERTTTLTTVIRERTNHFNNQLLHFSNSIMYTEVNHND
jgi:hypothetical protein